MTALAEHRLAAQLQNMIQPVPREPFPLAGLQAVVSYLPAESAVQVGGDWYHAQTLPDGQVALAVGDVAGHGLEAANGMAHLRFSLVAWLSIGIRDPGTLLGHMNRLCLQLGITGTAAIAVYDPARGTLSMGAGRAHAAAAGPRRRGRRARPARRAAARRRRRRRVPGRSAPGLRRRRPGAVLHRRAGRTPRRRHRRDARPGEADPGGRLGGPGRSALDPAARPAAPRQPGRRHLHPRASASCPDGTRSVAPGVWHQECGTRSCTGVWHQECGTRSVAPGVWRGSSGAGVGSGGAERGTVARERCGRGE